MMTDAIYGGVNAAVLTPMRADLSVDLDRMAGHSRWLLANGCNGLGVLGTTGEANSIGLSERIAVMEGLVERGIPARAMMPGTGVPAITDTVILTNKAVELGCPGVLVLPPFFYKNPSEDGLFAYYSEVIQRTGGKAKIYFYHFPAQSAVPITVALIGRLLKAYPGVVKGLKDSSGDYANTKSYVDHFAKDGFEVFCGDDSHLHQLLNAGGAGCITAASNVGSAVSAQVYSGWDQATGAAAQETLTAIRKAVTSAALIPGLKALVARNTGDDAWLNMRPPHMKLSGEAAQTLYATFDSCGVTLAKAA
ncbi:dihydrodipicolinate synthase family protein [uncultured Enterovirga sp.]|uniref:dihydrodipicolinate synthase family protein n=1 Tax=uncultured Enterovirga sp. TaxID=2026352 RepID=UPI0035CC431C